MTRYRDLCKSYAKYRSDQVDYRDKMKDCVALALVELRKSLDAPENTCAFAKINDRDESAGYSPQEAADYDADGWWGGCLLVGVSTSGMGRREDTVVLTILAKFEDGEIIYRVGDSDKRHAMKVATADSIRPVVEEALERGKRYLETGLDRFLDANRETPRHRIGFI